MNRLSTITENNRRRMRELTIMFVMFAMLAGAVAVTAAAESYASNQITSR